MQSDLAGHDVCHGCADSEQKWFLTCASVFVSVILHQAIQWPLRMVATGTLVFCCAPVAFSIADVFRIFHALCTHKRSICFELVSATEDDERWDFDWSTGLCALCFLLHALCSALFQLPVCGTLTGFFNWRQTYGTVPQRFKIQILPIYIPLPHDVLYLPLAFRMALIFVPFSSDRLPSETCSSTTGWRSCESSLFSLTSY